MKKTPAARKRTTIEPKPTELPDVPTHLRRLASFLFFAPYVVLFFALFTVLIIGTHHVWAPALVKQSAVSTDLNWLKLPGSERDKQGLHIRPLGSAIVNQDGSPNQANPPVNLTGSHFNVSGDFVMRADFKDAAAGGAILDFYGAVPVIYDEWRLETPRLSLSIYDRSVSVTIWDGNSDAPIETRNIAAGVAFNSLSFQARGGQFVIYVNSKQIGSIADHGVFRSGNIWVGADAKVGGQGWRLIALTAQTIGQGRVGLVRAASLVVRHNEVNTLRSLAASTPTHPKIGAAIAIGPLMTDHAYRSLAAGQFNLLTPENAMKAQFIHPQQAVYNFDEADTLVAFAKANDMTVHGHALVFGEANPRWMQDTPTPQREAMMTDHIRTVVSHYRAKVAEWDVVNEPLSDEDNGSLRNTIWYQAMGEGFIDKAFVAARAADPDAKLYINDYGLEADGAHWDAMIALLTRLQARGVPIDGVGFQSHVYQAADHEETALLRNHIARLAGMGLLSRVSEIDVHGDDQLVQANEYAGVLKACLAEPTCTSFTTWGITDKYGSTTETHNYSLDYGDDLLWGSDYQAKPALKALQQALKT